MSAAVASSAALHPDAHKRGGHRDTVLEYPCAPAQRLDLAGRTQRVFKSICLADRRLKR
jgi:hypothetical protein